MTHERRALVLSVADCSHYLVGYSKNPVGQADRIEVVRDESGRAVKFYSLYVAKRWLVNQGEKKAWLVMHTPYDEMVGRPESEQGNAEVPLVLVEGEAH